MLPVTVHAMDDVVAAAHAEPLFYTTLLAAFALLAVLLADAGVCSVPAAGMGCRGGRSHVR